MSHPNPVKEVYFFRRLRLRPPQMHPPQMHPPQTHPPQTHPPQMHNPESIYWHHLPPPPPPTPHLPKPSWSITTLLPPSVPTPETQKEITQDTLAHLMRLSALSKPPSEALAVLRSHVHFVRAVQAVDTTGVEPLSRIEDEVVRSPLEWGDVATTSRRFIRRQFGERHWKWDPMALPKRRVGDFYVVDEKVTEELDANEGVEVKSQSAVEKEVKVEAATEKIETMEGAVKLAATEESIEAAVEAAVETMVEDAVGEKVVEAVEEKVAAAEEKIEAAVEAAIEDVVEKIENVVEEKVEAVVQEMADTVAEEERKP